MERLKSDDRLLDALEASMKSDESLKDSEVTSQSERVQNLLAALQKAMTSSLRERLDRIYLQGLRGPSDTDQNKLRVESISDDQSTIDAQIQHVKDEIQTLYSEIDDIASMVVQHEHGRPLELALDKLKHEQQTRSMSKRAQNYQSLLLLTESVDNLATHYEMLNSLRVVIRDISQNSSLLQHHKKTNQNINQPVKSDKNVQPESEALVALLRHLNIDIDQNSQQMKDGSNTNDTSHLFTQINLLDEEITQTIQDILRTSRHASTNLIQPLNIPTSISKSKSTPIGTNAKTKANDPGPIFNERQEPFTEQITHLKDLDEKVTLSKTAVEEWTLSSSSSSQHQNQSYQNQERTKEMTAEQARQKLIQDWERRNRRR